jgi:hypothetical protein
LKRNKTILYFLYFYFFFHTSLGVLLPDHMCVCLRLCMHAPACLPPPSVREMYCALREIEGFGWLPAYLPSGSVMKHGNFSPKLKTRLEGSFWVEHECEVRDFELFSPCITNTRVLLKVAQSLKRLGHGLSGRGMGLRFPVTIRDISVLRNIQPGSGAHPASSPMDTGGFFPRVKRQGRESAHSHPSSAEDEDCGAIL